MMIHGSVESPVLVGTQENGAFDLDPRFTLQAEHAV